MDDYNMNNYQPPVALVQVWIYTLNTAHPKLERSREKALMSIKRFFGSTSVAELYIEQAKDKEIEIHIL